MKLFITGMAGGGKSTLAKELSSKHNIPTYETDLLAWDQINNVMITDSELDKVIDIKQKDWIIEGAYIVPKYIKAAEKVLYIKPNLLKSIFRIWKRYFTRPDVRKLHSFYKTIRLSISTVKDTLKKQTVDLNNIKSGFYSDKDRIAIVTKLAKKLENRK